MGMNIRREMIVQLSSKKLLTYFPRPREMLHIKDNLLFRVAADTGTQNKQQIIQIIWFEW